MSSPRIPDTCASGSRWVGWFSLPIFLVALAGVPIGSASAQPRSVHIRWTIGAVRTEKDDYRFMPVHKDTELQSGDYFKFHLEALQPVHVYLIHQDSQGRVMPLLVHIPQPSDRPQERPEPLRISLPGPGKPWLRFDDQTGDERFYLIASVTRSDTLEALLEALAQERPEQRTEAGKLVIAEIRRLRKAHKALARDSERPVALGGQVRGMESDSMPDLDWDRLDRQLLGNVMEVRTPTFYGRTVTIDHIAP